MSDSKRSAGEDAGSNSSSAATADLVSMPSSVLSLDSAAADSVSDSASAEKKRPPATPPLAEDLVGETISERYKIEKVLGKGGMGAVYLVQHVHMRKHYALKMLHAETSQNPELVARFEREAVASAHAEHPNITVATDFGRTDGGSFFLVLEYLEGKRLRDEIAKGPIAWQRAVHIARQVASALEVAHGLGIVHRDLKPENIMLINRQGDEDFVKVLDFGLAKVATESLPTAGEEPLETITRHGTIFGTPRYMAPEQCVGEAVDARTDLYALGMVLYEMLAGTHPFDGSGVVALVRQQLSSPVPAISKRAPQISVPPELEALMMRLVSKRAAERCQSAKDLVAAFDVIAPQSSQPSTPSGTQPKLEPTEPSAKQQPTQQVTPSAIIAAEAVPANEAETRAAIAAPTVAGFNAAAVTQLPLGAQQAAAAAGFMSRLPAPLRKNPALLLLPLGLFAAVAFFALRTPKSPSLPPVRTGSAPQVIQQPKASELAPQAELDQAIKGGLVELLQLATRFPRDVKVLRAVAHTYMAQGDGVEALRYMARILAINETLVVDGEIIQAVNMTLDRADTQEAAFALLENELGARGVDVLLALAQKPGASRGKSQARSRQSLGMPEVRAHASPAALIALDLRTSGKCEAKHALLPRAEQFGDQRTLQQLKALAQPRGCGTFQLSDCWPCLRKDNALQSAIAAITARGHATN